MKIAYIYDSTYLHSIGGIERRIWELATRLVQRGHEVTLFGMKHWEGEDCIVREGVRLWGVCPPQEVFVNGRRPVKEAIYFAYKVLFPLLSGDFDVVDCQNFPYFPCFSAKLASIKRKSRLIITWHEVWDNYWFEYLGRKGIFGKVIERIVAHLTDEIVAVSGFTKGDLERIGVSKDIRVIPNGIDFKRISQIAPSNRESDVIFAGRLVEQKNVDLLIKSIKRIKEEIPDISCMIIGDGPERSNLERLIHELNLEDNILMAGFKKEHEQVFSYMKSSKVFVSPSTREGFGIASLEANACGLPVITINHPQNATCSLVTEGENGFICEFSEEDITRRILEVMDGKNSLGSHCVGFARNFDWDEVAKLAERVYQGK